MNQTMNTMLPVSSNEEKRRTVHFFPSHTLWKILFVQNKKKSSSEGKKKQTLPLS